jgi:hypothetical protein
MIVSCYVKEICMAVWQSSLTGVKVVEKVVRSKNVVDDEAPQLCAYWFTAMLSGRTWTNSTRCFVFSTLCLSCAQKYLQWLLFRYTEQHRYSWCMFVRASLSKRREENQLDATEWFIALIICSTCFGHLYAHHQELETILVLLLHMVCGGLVAGSRQSGAGQQAMRLGWGKLYNHSVASGCFSSLHQIFLLDL